MATIATLGVALKASTGDFRAQMEAGAASVKGFERSHLSLKQVVEQTRTPHERYEAQVQQLSTWLQKGKIDAETFARAQEKAADSMRLAESAGRRESAILESLHGHWERITHALEFVGAMEAGRKLFDLAREALESAEHMAHLAETTGIAESNLSRLQFAAKASNVDMESLTSAIMRMERNLSTAAVEGGQTARMLEAFGFHVRELRAMAPDQAFLAVAAAIESLGSPMDRAAAAQQIFGRGWTSIMPLLAQGTAHMAELSAMSDRMGFTIDHAAAESAMRAGEAIRILGLHTEAAGRQIAVALAPYVESLSQKLQQLQSDGERMSAGLRTAIRDVAIPSLAFLADAFQAVRNVAGYTAMAILTIGEALNTIADAIPAFANLVTGGLIGPLNDFVGQMHDAHRIMELAHDDIEKQIDTSHGPGGSYGDQIRAMLNGIADSADKLKNHAEGARSGFAAIAEGAAEAEHPVKKLRDEMGDLLKHLQDQIDAYGKTQYQVEKFKASLIENPVDLTGHMGTTVQDIAIQRRYAEFEALRRQAMAMADWLQKKQEEKEALAEEQRYFQDAARAAREYDKFFEEANKKNQDFVNSLVHRGETPLQRLAGDLMHLNELFRAGSISLEDYTKGLSAIEAEQNKLTNKPSRANQLAGRSEEFDPRYMRLGGPDGADRRHNEQMTELRKHTQFLQDMDTKLPSVTN